MKFSDLVAQLSPQANSLTTNRDLNPEITGIMAVHEAVTNTLSYIEGDKFASMVAKTTASALILPLDQKLQAQADEHSIAWMATPQPRLMFAQAIKLFYQPFHPSPSIHPSAVINPSAVIFPLALGMPLLFKTMGPQCYGLGALVPSVVRILTVHRVG